MILQSPEFKRIFDYIKANLHIMKKKMFEYKTNTYNMALLVLFSLITGTFFASVLAKNFSHVILWTTKEFLLLVFIANLIWGIHGIFRWSGGINDYLIFGTFNSLLMKPISMPIKFYFHNLNGGGLIFSLISLIYGIFIIFFYNIELYNLFLSFFVFILLILYFNLFWFTLDSLNLIQIGLGDGLKNPFEQVAYMLGSYPIQFFSDSKLKYILIVIPTYFTTSLLIPLLRNLPVKNFILQISLLIIFIVVLFIILRFNWKYGLKNYEAFG